MDSYMVCANGGLIVPVTDGQTVEKWLANNGDDLEYEDYLAYLGFPQVYIYYLLDLHAEYPNLSRFLLMLILRSLYNIR